MLRLALIGLAVLLASWTALGVLARRLPPGTARDLATVLPACATTIRRLRRDPRVPRRAKVAVAFAGLWVISPIDLIPEFLPVTGPLDDVIVVALALRYAARRVPREVIWRLGPPNRDSHPMPGGTVRHERLEQPVVVVFGASSGIGLAASLLAGGRGAEVVVLGRARRVLDTFVGEASPSSVVSHTHR